MAVTYTTAVKNSRLSAVITAIGGTGVLAIGATLCQAAAASPTMAELEAAIIGPMTSGPLPPLQWGFLAGAAGGTMCLDELVRLGVAPAM